MQRASAVVVVGLGVCGACDPGGREPCDPAEETCGADAEPAPDLSDVTFVVRTHPVILADGLTAVPVVVTAAHSDGTPVTGSFVLGLDRPGAGVYDTATIVLGEDGGAAMFTPCTANTSGCLGPLVLTLAPAWSLSTIVAEAPTMLAVEEVGTVAACLGFERRMHFFGNDYIYNGAMTVVNAEWMASGDLAKVMIDVRPTAPSQGAWWDLQFTTVNLGVELVPGVYEMAERYPFESDGRPGMDVSGDGRGCNELDGRFQVFEYILDGAEVDSATISFEQHCEHSTTMMLSGCVHYLRADP
jgi:hypothetical protein